MEAVVNLTGKRVLVTGGTGSLGQRVVERLLSGRHGLPSSVLVFSRDEAKQHYMRVAFHHRGAETDDAIYRSRLERLRFMIGDVRDYWSVCEAVRQADVIIHAAALKQVPSCEYFSDQAVQTNITGALNLVRAVREVGPHVEMTVGISTDKACKPVNVMGMTKAVMERILIEANLRAGAGKFVCVRYGNVIASRGSVVPFFMDQIASGGPVTITMPEMTRFLLSLDRAVDTVIEALDAERGEIVVPRVPAARIVDLAEVLIDGRKVEVVNTGIRPGEKIHEIMVSDEEAFRTFARNEYYVIAPMLPELARGAITPAFAGEYSSEQITLDHAGLRDLLREHLTGDSARDLTA
jgi:FlaA1/EpsC-like NDP-sugar epimerase